MNTFIIPSSSITRATAFHHRSPHSTIFPQASRTRNQLCYSFTESAANAMGQGDLLLVDEHTAIKNYVKSIKSIFHSLDDGAINPSAYDTAWVSLIDDVNNGPCGGPQFPSSLEWVVNNQLPDGSWGETFMFSAFERVLNTLACVIALTYWNIHPNKCERGMKFVEENINKIRDEKEEHMTQGFEILFPSLLDRAQKLGIKVPKNNPVLEEIYAKRDVKLTKIPKEAYHKIPTIILYILEGLKDLEWEKLLKLQSEDGSFFYSPSATAFAFMQTKDQKCLSYLTNIVSMFNGGAPTLYPVDMFEHIWMVDRLERLGIARYFRSEIKDCARYIYKYWNEQGIGLTKNCIVPDIDDTALGFMVLRTNGYQISPDVFRHFEKDGKFVCYHGQSAEAVTCMFDLYRATQLLFPGEKILDNAKKFSYNFLTEKRLNNELDDKWLITKDLPGEVIYALDVPWYASLPRLEARYYVEQYSGSDDVWIGKSLYRMEYVSNDNYLEMAKLDYNQCQSIHQLEWNQLQEWYSHLNFEHSLNKSLLWSYYVAAASIFEPERSNERVAWAKTTVILDIITSFFAQPQFSNTDIQAFVDEFTNAQQSHINGKSWYLVINAIRETLNEISTNARVAHGVDIHPHLHRAWKLWLLNWAKGVDRVVGDAELIVLTINMTSRRWLLDEPLSHPQYRRLSSITNNICHQIASKGRGIEIDSKMQELVQLVLCDSTEDLDHDLKHTFLTVAKTFYYLSYFDPETINKHIHKVLVERVF